MWWSQGQDDDDELELIFSEITQELEITVPDMPWKDAYEINKDRDTCILCGKKTVRTSLFLSVINTCPCVDALAKGE